jgi:exopolysaccharide production protein ExoZ
VPQSRPREIISLQYLRAVAALLVVFHHARNPGNGLFDPISHWNFGQAGVDMFFLISGYIMFAVAKADPPIQFLMRRLIRIAPLYWLATILLYAQISIGFPGVLPNTEQLLKSLLFIPQYHWESPKEVWPLVVPGWTLQYEMYFYAIFAIGLTVRRLVPVSLAIGLLAIAIGWAVPGWIVGDAVLVTYTSPIIIEFFAGMLIAIIHQRYTLESFSIALPVGVIALIGIGNLDASRLVIWGLPTLLIFVGTLAVEDAQKLPRVPLLKLLGDASYSIYLAHAFVLQIGLFAWWRVPVRGWPQFLIFTPTALIGCAFVGVLVHRFIEMPILLRLQPKKRTPSPQNDNQESSSAVRPSSAAN